MAISKVQNFASILCNNALAGGKVDNGFNMFETPPSSCSTDSRHGEYDPWNYDLLGRNSNNQATLEEEEAQDLNNSMVNDLVAKILDDDPIITEETYAHRYNGNPRSSETQNSRMLKGRNATLSNYQDDIGMSQIYYPYNKLPSMGATHDESHREFVNMYSALNSMTLNDCIAQTLEKANIYENVTSSNCPRTILTDGEQRPRVGNDSRNIPMRNYTISNGQPTNGHNYTTVQSTNWSDNCGTHDYTKDIFGNYQNVQNSNHDLNFNTIALGEMDISRGIGNNHNHNNQHHHHHHYSNQTLSNPDSYNPTTANSHDFRVSSSMNEMNADSVFTGNSSIQHFSSSESNLQNCLGTNYIQNYEEYKDIHERMTTSTMHSDSLYLQQNNFKTDRQMDQNYKALMNRYRSMNDFNLPLTDISQNDSIGLNQNHIDSNLLKVMSPRSKNHDVHNQTPKLRVYPRNSTTRQSEQPNTKSNYHVHNGYQHYTASNTENFKAMPQNFPAPLKRSNTQCSYKIDPYDFSDVPFNGNAHLAQQITRVSMENNVFNHIMKRHQQIQRMSGVPGAGVLLNARLMRPGNSQGTVFPSVMPVVQVPVPPINPMSVLFNRLNMRNGARSARRGGPSSVLHLRLEQTFEQFKLLEKERKKCEATLADHFPGKRVSSVNNIPTPRLQGSASRADRLIVDHFQEHARVITLIAKMEHLRGATMSKRIHKAMENWLESIKYVQECRKKEIEYTNMRRNENLECMPINDDKRVLALAGSIHQLAKASRLARSGMFNALQATLLHDKEIERRIIENVEDPIVSAKEQVEEHSTNGEIGQLTETT